MLASSIMGQSTETEDDVGCKFQIGSNKWDFSSLVRSATENAYKIVYTTSGQGDTTIYFNICEYVTENYDCDSGNAFANELRVDGSWYRLTDGKISNAIPEYYRNTNHTKGLSLVYGTGDICPYSSNDELFHMTLNVVCDSGRTGNPEIQLLSNSLFDPCNPIIQVNHAEGCATREANAFWDFLDDIYFIMGPLAIAIGAVYTFAGLRLYKPILLMTGSFTTSIVCIVPLYGLLFDGNDSLVIGILVVALSLGLGAYIGQYVARFSKIGVALVGFWSGVVAAFVLFFYTTYPLYNPTIGLILLWSVGIVAGGGSAYLNLKMFPKTYVYSTSLIGSYLIIRGINAFVGEYTNEFLILYDIEEDRYDYVSYGSYLNMAAVLVLALIGVVVQYLTTDVKNFKEQYQQRNERLSYKNQPEPLHDPTHSEYEE